MNKTNVMAAIAALLLPQTTTKTRPLSLIMPSSTRTVVRGFRRPKPGWRLEARKRAYRELAYRRRRNA